MLSHPLRFFWLPFCVVTLWGCATQPYEAKPLSPEASARKFTEHAPDSQDFQDFLLQHGYTKAQLPLTAWGIDELTLSAIFHHPKLKVAEAQRVLAEITVQTASRAPNPTINGHLAKSNQANGDIRPWSYGLALDIPIETTNKRQIRTQEAKHLADAARLDVVETIWNLRNQISQDVLALQENTASIKQLQKELGVQQEIISMLEKRLGSGLVSKPELHTYQLLVQKTANALQAEQTRSTVIEARLASDCGLSLPQFKKIKLNFPAPESVLTEQTTLLAKTTLTLETQQTALLNRADIRRALARYAAAETKIQLEIAKQTPDFSISPGFAFEFGDKIWSLGIATLLNLVNKNQTLVAEATQLREIEAAQFEALQAKIIVDLSQAEAEYRTYSQTLTKQQQLYDTQKKQHQSLEKKFAAGLVDRLELTQNTLNLLLTSQQLQTLQFSTLNAILQIENILQHPLEPSGKSYGESYHE